MATVASLFAALCKAVTTTNGTSSDSIVLLNVGDSFNENDDVSLCPVLFQILAGPFRAALLPSHAEVGKELTRSESWPRGPKSKGVYYLGDGQKSIKYSVPTSGPAPYVLRRLETSKSKIESNVRSLAEMVPFQELTATLFKDKFSFTEAQKLSALVSTITTSVLNVSYFGEPKPAKKRPSSSLSSEKDKNGSSSKIPRVLNIAPEDSPQVASLNNASNLVLENPDAARHFVELAKHLKRVSPELMHGLPAMMSPPSKAARAQIVAGEQVGAMLEHARRVTLQQQQMQRQEQQQQQLAHDLDEEAGEDGEEYEYNANPYNLDHYEQQEQDEQQATSPQN